MSKYSNSRILNIFGCSDNFNDKEFKKFIEHVHRLATKQTKMSNKKLQNTNSLSESTFLVAIAQNKSICANKFESLLENEWLADTIIDFVGMILKKNYARCSCIHNAFHGQPHPR
jgi:Ulp1 family protease